MAELRFDIPNYDIAMIDFFSAVMDGFYDLDPLLGQISRRVIVHGGVMRNVRGETPLDQPMPEIQFMAALEINAIKETDFEALTSFLVDLSEQSLNSMKEEMFKGLIQVTEATGMRFVVKGHPFSLDHFYDILEKMYIDFDADGQPILPTAIVAPDVYEKIKNIEPTPEQLQRRDEILLRKKREFDDKKRYRRLS